MTISLLAKRPMDFVGPTGWALMRGALSPSPSSPAVAPGKDYAAKLHDCGAIIRSARHPAGGPIPVDAGARFSNHSLAYCARRGCRRSAGQSGVPKQACAACVSGQTPKLLLPSMSPTDGRKIIYLPSVKTSTVVRASASGH